MIDALIRLNALIALLIALASAVALATIVVKVRRRRYFRRVAKEVGWCLCDRESDPHTPH